MATRMERWIRDNGGGALPSGGGGSGGGSRPNRRRARPNHVTAATASSSSSTTTPYFSSSAGMYVLSSNTSGSSSSSSSSARNNAHSTQSTGNRRTNPPLRNNNRRTSSSSLSRSGSSTLSPTSLLPSSPTRGPNELSWPHARSTVHHHTPLLRRSEMAGSATRRQRSSSNDSDTTGSTTLRGVASVSLSHSTNTSVSSSRLRRALSDTVSMSTTADNSSSLVSSRTSSAIRTPNSKGHDSYLDYRKKYIQDTKTVRSSLDSSSISSSSSRTSTSTSTSTSSIRRSKSVDEAKKSLKLNNSRTSPVRGNANMLQLGRQAVGGSGGSAGNSNSIGGIRASSTITTTSPTSSSALQVPFVGIAIEAYDAQRDSEISVGTGDEIRVTDVASSEHWWYGEVLAKQVQGWLPKSIVLFDGVATPRGVKTASTVVALSQSNKSKSSAPLPLRTKHGLSRPIQALLSPANALVRARSGNNGRAFFNDAAAALTSQGERKSPIDDMEPDKASTPLRRFLSGRGTQWAEYAAQEGNVYFHNTNTNEVNWSRPKSAQPMKRVRDINGQVCCFCFFLPAVLRLIMLMFLFQFLCMLFVLLFF